MRTLRTVLYATVIVALAGCGGSSTLTPPATGPGSATAPATLWVAYQLKLQAFPASANGAVAPTQTLPRFVWSPSAGLGENAGIRDLAVAPDGTRWLLEESDYALFGPGWRLLAFAPNDQAPRTAYGDDRQYPVSVAAGRDGIILNYYDASANSNTIVTYPYSANPANPIRTLQTSNAQTIAEGSDGNLYVSYFDTGIKVYRPTSSGYNLIANFTIGSARGFKLGSDNSIYVPDLAGSHTNPVMYVDVYAPGSATLARRLGPMPATYNGFDFPNIAVDSQDRLYVDAAGTVSRFAPGANGTDKPQIIMILPPSDLVGPKAIALGPPL